ncbi:hypothetical protein Tco_0959667, partial [Tanacetum coccineum]
MKIKVAMAQIEAVGASEKEALKRLEATQKEIDEFTNSTEEALKRSYMVKAAQKAMVGHRHHICQVHNVSHELMVAKVSSTLLTDVLLL